MSKTMDAIKAEAWQAKRKIEELETLERVATAFNAIVQENNMLHAQIEDLRIKNSQLEGDRDEALRRVHYMREEIYELRKRLGLFPNDM